MVADEPSVETEVATEPDGVPAETEDTDMLALPEFVVTVWNVDTFDPPPTGPTPPAETAPGNVCVCPESVAVWE